MEGRRCRRVEARGETMSAKLRVVLACVMALAVLALVACGGGGSVEVNKDGKSVTVDTQNGSVEVSGTDSKVSVAKDQELPEGFPADFPVYDGTIDVATEINAEGLSQMFQVRITTPDSVKTVRDWYRTEAEKAGWEVEDKGEVEIAEDKTYILTITNAEYNGMVNISEAGAGETVISTNVSAVKK